MTAARSPRGHGGVSDVICDLRDRIASMEGGAAKRAGTLAFGVPEIDAALPGGGLAYEPCMSLRAEIRYSRWRGCRAFCGRHCRANQRPRDLCLTRPDLFFPALAHLVSIPTASSSWSPTGKRMC